MTNQLAALLQKLTPNLRQIIGNASWLILDKVLRMVISLVIGTWVARYLGPVQYGLYNYGFAFVSLLAPIASLGLDSIIVREIVSYPQQKNELLGSTFILKLIGGLISLGVAFCGISLLRPSDTLSQQLIVILAIGFIFQAFETIDFWFQAQVQSKKVVVAKSCGLLISNILKVGLIQLKAPLIAFAYIFLLEIALSSLGTVFAYRLVGKKIFHWRPNWRIAKKLLKDSCPFMLSAAAIIVYMKIDQLMLGEIMGDKAVGIYSAAVRMSEVWYFIPAAIASSITPHIVKTRQINVETYYQTLSTTFNLMSLLAYGISIGMSLFAPLIITKLFGVEYSDSILILSIHIWSSIFIFLGAARGIFLVAENLSLIDLQTTIVGAVVNVVLNLILIPKFSGLGAAIATVIAYCIAILLSCFLYVPLRRIGYLMLSAMTLSWLFRRVFSRFIH